MSETPMPTAEETPAAPASTSEPPVQEDTTDWKAEARKWEARAKENRSAAAELQQLKDAEKTELQRAAEKVAAAQREAEAAKAEAARLRIAAKHGISEEYLDLLTGDDEEELEAKAKKLAALVTAQTKSEPNAAGSDVPPTVGSVPGRTGNMTLAEKIEAAVKAGDKQLVSVLKAQQLGTAK